MFKELFHPVINDTVFEEAEEGEGGGGEVAVHWGAGGSVGVGAGGLIPFFVVGVVVGVFGCSVALVVFIDVLLVRIDAMCGQ